jgi:hypothetical protein
MRGLQYADYIVGVEHEGPAVHDASAATHPFGSWRARVIPHRLLTRINWPAEDRLRLVLTCSFAIQPVTRHLGSLRPELIPAFGGGHGVSVEECTVKATRRITASPLV